MPRCSKACNIYLERGRKKFSVTIFWVGYITGVLRGSFSVNVGWFGVWGSEAIRGLCRSMLPLLARFCHACKPLPQPLSSGIAFRKVTPTEQLGTSVSPLQSLNIPADRSGHVDGCAPQPEPCKPSASAKFACRLVELVVTFIPST